MAFRTGTEQWMKLANLTAREKERRMKQEQYIISQARMRKELVSKPIQSTVRRTTQVPRPVRIQRQTPRRRRIFFGRNYPSIDLDYLYPPPRNQIYPPRGKFIW